MEDKVIPIKQACRRGTRQLMLCMLVYVVVLCISLSVMHSMKGGWERVVVALLPVGPCLAMFWVVVRLHGTLDEMVRRVHLEAAAMTLGIVAMSSLTWGFLQNVGFPPLSGFVVFVAAGWIYAALAAVLKWRYR